MADIFQPIQFSRSVTVPKHMLDANFERIWGPVRRLECDDIRELKRNLDKEYRETISMSEWIRPASLSTLEQWHEKTVELKFKFKDLP